MISSDLYFVLKILIYILAEKVSKYLAMSTTVDYRSSEEVIFVLKKAMKIKSLENQLGSESDDDDDVHTDLVIDVESQELENQLESEADTDTDMVVDVERQAAIVLSDDEDEDGGRGDSPQPHLRPQLQPQLLQPPPPAKNFPQLHSQFCKSVLLLKGK